MDNEALDESTQIRIIRAEAQEAVAEQMKPVLETIRTTAMEIKSDIKEEMHRYFPTKHDLAEYKLEHHKDTKEMVENLILKCESKHHSNKTSRPPAQNKKATAKMSAIIGGTITGVGGAIWGLYELFTKISG